MYKVMDTIVPDTVSMRDVYTDTVVELAGSDERVFSLEADLMGAIGKHIKQTFPERTFDLGVQEANVVGVAGGLSAAGKIPFVHTFATFLTRRAFDQIYIALGYNKQNVKLVGSDPGIFATHDGGTHMEFSDMSLLRGVPHSTVMEPADAVSMHWALKKAKDTDGLFYIRTPRVILDKIYADGSEMEIGKGNILREGKDVTLIASGLMLGNALKAAQVLAGQGVEARVVDMFTWKPLDETLIAESASKTGAIVTVENHNLLTGLGAAVSSAVTRSFPVPMEMVGVQDEFGQVGTLEELAGAYGLTTENIIEKTKAVLARKAK